MISLIDNPAHWIARAEEVRAVADDMQDPESKRMLLKIAEDYDTIAERAQRRLNEKAAREGIPDKG